MKGFLHLKINDKTLSRLKPVLCSKTSESNLLRLINHRFLNENHIFKYVIIGMESASFYGVHIANYLSVSDKLTPFSVRVYCLNPKEVAKYKASFNALDKTDGIDSFVIADFARVGRISIQPWQGSQYLALQRLTEHRMHITECIAREKSYMLNNIFLKFSEFAMLQKNEHPFSNKYGSTAEAILTEYLTNEDLVNASMEEPIDFINSKSRGRISEPQETAVLLQTAAKNSYRPNKCLYEPLTISIACSFNCISSFERELKAIDSAILKTVNGLNPVEYAVLNSIPGIGKVCSAGILSEIGSIKWFKDNDALAKYCGIAWKRSRSSKFEAEDTPMSKAGNRYLRYYIMEATGSIIRHCPEYKAFYDKKFAEVTTHQHKRALALTSRKFLRMLFGLLDKSQLYSPDKSR
ncbi:MAG: IS110 family transposase [Clostridiales bacterium]|nr:IS110 family transposase [Clostridiales bacterium]